MVLAAEIAWSHYRDYEGPFYRGRSRFQLPAQPAEADRFLAVITATEGGTWDAYNGYDRCICTSGLIQWCEASQFSVSDMLGVVAAHDRSLIASVDAHAASCGLTFKPNAKGRYRFFFLDARGEVDRLREQQEMFLLHSDGKKGTWDEASRARAKAWAAAISSVWEHTEAQRLQGEFTARRLSWFVATAVKPVWQQAPDTKEGAAFRAAYLSFAANNPTWASQQLQIAMTQTDHALYSRDWLIAVLRQLTYGPKVAIYPHRYNAIRPVLEQLYGVDLPDFAAELAKLEDDIGVAPLTVTEVQAILISLGFDLGPWGADGKFGKKTREAVVSFQQLRRLDPTGAVDAPTLRALITARDAGILDEDRPTEPGVVPMGE